MKIFCISVVKNEADIIEESLKDACKWSDKIFVLDNDSDDDTWKKVNELAKKESKIVPWKVAKVPFYNGLRAEVFNEFKHLAKEGDWWCMRLDADEFYVDDPRKLLEQIPKNRHFVCKDSIEYRLTYEDLEEELVTYSQGEFRNIQYYESSSYRETRFFRHRGRLSWDPKDSFPKRMGIVSDRLIRVKHFPHRCPAQIQKRIDIRNEAKKQKGFKAFKHVTQTTYKHVLVSRDQLVRDTMDGEYHLKGAKNDYHHKPYVRMIKQVLHGIGIWP